MRVLLAAWVSLLFVLGIASSCSIDHPSDAFACTTPSQCSDGRSCVDGFCVVSTGSACPSQCTTCDTAAKTCGITGGNGNTITCPSGFHCDITCAGGNCRTVDCSTAASCTILCSGEGSCEIVTCGAGPCDVTCSGKSSCKNGVNCQSSCACDVLCTGQQSCDSGSRCPMQACDSGPGCTSLPASCDRCF